MVQNPLYFELLLSKIKFSISGACVSHSQNQEPGDLRLTEINLSCCLLVVDKEISSVLKSKGDLFFCWCIGGQLKTTNRWFINEFGRLLVVHCNKSSLSGHSIKAKKEREQRIWSELVNLMYTLGLTILLLELIQEFRSWVVIDSRWS